MANGNWKMENKNSILLLFKRYYYLTKPGIIYANTMSAIAGFLLAAKWHIDFFALAATIVGIAFVIASGCVINNYIDRGIDEKMERTKRRALVKKSISVTNALVFATLLGISGLGLLYFLTTPLAAFVAFLGFFFYVVMYTIFKRASVHGTVVGSVAGAVPPVVGYTAVSNNFDTAALLLFLLLVFWQMPHFYSIALFRLNDYKATGLPVMPVALGVNITKIYIICYIIAFIITLPFLTFFGYTGYLYLIVLLLISIVWLVKGVKGFNTQSSEMWAKGMFKFSLLVLLTLCVMISIGI